MVDPKNTAIIGKVARSVVAHRRVPLKAFYIRCAQPKRDAIQLRFVPSNRKSNRRIKEDAEVISVIRELHKVVALNLDVSAERLLQTDIELISAARGKRGLA